MSHADRAKIPGFRQWSSAPATRDSGAESLVLPSLRSRHIQQESLIRRYVPRGVANRRGGFADGPQLSILPADLKFEIVHRAMFLQQAASAARAPADSRTAPAQSQPPEVHRGSRSPRYASTHR